MLTGRTSKQRDSDWLEELGKKKKRTKFNKNNYKPLRSLSKIPGHKYKMYKGLT